MITNIHPMKAGGAEPLLSSKNFPETMDRPMITCIIGRHENKAVIPPTM
jgi:hypothetical protein